VEENLVGLVDVAAGDGVRTKLQLEAKVDLHQRPRIAAGCHRLLKTQALRRHHERHAESS
jgi:hypothetical protein